MPDRKTIEDFLSQRYFAFVGVSRDSNQFANSVYRILRENGRTFYPVNAAANGQLLEGDPSYRTLGDVPDPVDGVMVMVPASQAADIVREAIERGIPRAWLHRGAGQGSVSEEAVSLCREAGIAVVDGACPLMYEEPVLGIHRLHRWLLGRQIAA
jgi:predicted CoA-binding protein